MFQPFEIILPIRVTAEDHLPLISTADGMIKRPGKCHSRFNAMVPHYVIHQLIMKA
jgi:hypothetical protein